MKLIKETNNFSLLLDCPASKIPKDFFDLPFEKMVKEILGKNYFVSLVFVRESKIKALNKAFRGKDASTDILSFDLEDEGEILISINNARRKAREREENIEEYLAFLFIHGLLHLKGMQHGSKMERKEKKLNEKIQNYSRHRHRHLSGKGDRRRRG